MKNESNLIDTKEELLKNFNEEQMKIYNYYKSKFSYANEELYPITREDKEMILLEKTCKILKSVLKYEAILSFFVITFMVMFKM